MSALLHVRFWAHICFTENREERETEESGRMSWRYRRGDTQRLTASIMRIQQSTVRPSSWSSERSVCMFSSCVFLDICLWVCELIVYWCLCQHLRMREYTVGDVCEHERQTHHKGWQVWAVDHKWGHWLTPLLCGQACPNLSSPSFRLQAPFHFDGQYVLLPRNTRLLYN